MNILTPEQIKQIRKDAGLTQKQAGALVHRALRTWQEYEAGDTVIDPAAQELILIKSVLSPAEQEALLLKAVEKLN